MDFENAEQVKEFMNSLSHHKKNACWNVHERGAKGHRKLKLNLISSNNGKLNVVEVTEVIHTTRNGESTNNKGEHKGMVYSNV